MLHRNGSPVRKWMLPTTPGVWRQIRPHSSPRWHRGPSSHPDCSLWDSEAEASARLCPDPWLTEAETVNACWWSHCVCANVITQRSTTRPLCSGGSKTTLRSSDSPELSKLYTLGYSLLQWKSAVKKEKAHRAGARRHQNPLPVESEEQCLILPATVCDNVWGVRSVNLGNSPRSWHPGLLVEEGSQADRPRQPGGWSWSPASPEAKLVIPPGLRPPGKQTLLPGRIASQEPIKGPSFL